MNVDYSCYEGREVQGASDVVLSRGKVVIEGGKYTGTKGDGRFLKRGGPRGKRREGAGGAGRGRAGGPGPPGGPGGEGRSATRRHGLTVPPTCRNGPDVLVRRQRQ